MSTPVVSLVVSARTTTSISFTWDNPLARFPDNFRIIIQKEGDTNVVEDETTTNTLYRKYVDKEERSRKLFFLACVDRHQFVHGNFSRRSGLIPGATYVITVRPIQHGVEGEPNVLTATLSMCTGLHADFTQFHFSLSNLNKANEVQSHKS